MNFILLLTFTFTLRAALCQDTLKTMRMSLNNAKEQARMDEIFN